MTATARLRLDERLPVLNRLPRWFPPLSTNEWKALRVTYAVLLLLFAQWPDVRPLVNLPSTLLDPAPGTTALVGSDLLRSEVAINLLHWGGVAVVVAFALGTRFSVLAVTGWAILAHSVLFSPGKIDHTFLPWFVPFALSASGWGSREPRRWDFAQSTFPASVMLAVAWLTAATPKLWGGWLSPSSRSVVDILDERDPAAFTAEFLSLPSALLEVVDWSVVAGEFALVLAVLGPRSVRAAAVLCCAVFHFSVLAVFGIGYDTIVPAYLVLLAPLTFLPAKRSLLSQRTVGSVVALAAMWRLLSSEDRLQLWLFDSTSSPKALAAILMHTCTASLAVLCLMHLRSHRPLPPAHSID